MQDIRYKQRFHNYSQSFALLQDSLKVQNPTILEKAGIIQFFEITFELSWKLLKDYCEYIGYDIHSPRDAIKTAYSIGIIDNGQTWLDALMDRNLTVHTYDEDIANEVYNKIKNEYYPLLEKLYDTFKDKVCTD
ncbi:MAG TPA: nucleotidyltransferase substrate binding protein [Spirochaetota bacterium]|nr:nucleotidyltransferase substrate binding protein [Spirochaetota bacterium]HOM10803.1 nucleotidyltransferase substrate binding protein [Spirochaetota bacterium]HPP50650.1 nucleotidyltransferase substrate binding protein [Spirochaetota bacterium]